MAASIQGASPQPAPKRRFFTFCVRVAAGLLIASSASPAQVLRLPARPPGGLKGSALIPVLTPLSLTDRENRIFAEITAGNVPAFLRILVPVTSTVSIGGLSRSITFYVTPDYLAVGEDDDYFLTPMTPLLAQRIADALHCTLPTRAMVNAIYAAAAVKLAPLPISPSAAMITVPVFAQHNQMVREQRAPVLAEHPLGALVGGTKKDVILSNRIREGLKPAVPRPVVIYGWHQLNGVPIQPLYNGHEETYADYSHGIRLVQDSLLFEGAPATVGKILKDSTLNLLLSDEGVIPVPRYGDLPSGVELREGENAPGRLGLRFQPNPFNPATTISYRLPVPSDVTLTVFNRLGQRVTTLVSGSQEAGLHEVRFDGSGLASGVYFSRLSTVPLEPRNPGMALPAGSREAQQLLSVATGKLMLLR